MLLLRARNSVDIPCQRMSNLSANHWPPITIGTKATLRQIPVVLLGSGDVGIPRTNFTSRKVQSRVSRGIGEARRLPHASSHSVPHRPKNNSMSSRGGILGLICRTSIYAAAENGGQSLGAVSKKLPANRPRVAKDKSTRLQ